MPAGPTDPSAKPFQGGLEQAEAAASAIEGRFATLTDEKERLREELDLIVHYRAVVEYLAKTLQGIDESRWLAVLPFLAERAEDLTVLEQELASELDGRFLLVQGRLNDLLAAVIIVLKRDAEDAKGALSHQGLGELPRPEKYAGMSMSMMAAEFAERSRRIPETLAGLQAEMDRELHKSESELKSLWNRAKDESARLLAFREMGAVRYGFALFGWVPKRLKQPVEAVMGRFGSRIVSVFEPAETRREAGRVPVLLENAGWIKNFEPLITFLNTPRYDSWDPTWVVAVYFPLWFGMIVGDIGYAAVFAGVSLYLYSYVRRKRTLAVDFFKMRLAPEKVAQVVRASKPMILWTLIWGLLYGECFGDFLQQLGVFGTARHPGWIPILIPRTDTVATADTLLLFSIGFGVYQVLYGFYRKAMRTHRNGEKAHFWEASGYFGGRCRPGSVCIRIYG